MCKFPEIFALKAFVLSSPRHTFYAFHALTSTTKEFPAVTSKRYLAICLHRRRPSLDNTVHGGCLRVDQTQVQITTEPTTDPGQEGRRVRRRVILFGLLMLPFNVYWVIVSELRWYVILTLNPLFVTPIFYLFLLVGANSMLRRFAPRWVLRPAELVVLYVMMVISCTIATHDFMINLMSSMGYARWFATPENQWETTMFPHLPR
jgi:hypothetical protein